MSSELNTYLSSALDQLRSLQPNKQFKEFARIIERSPYPLLPSDAPKVIGHLVRFVGPRAGEYLVLSTVGEFISKLLEGREATTLLDPAAGLGSLVSVVQTTTNPDRTIGIDVSHDAVEIGQALNPRVEWMTTDSIAFLNGTDEVFDLVVSSLPLGLRSDTPLVLTALDRSTLEIRGETSFQILVSSAARLAPAGLGIYIVSASFFWSPRSPFRQLSRLGLYVDAAISLPQDTFAPFSNVSAYLVIISRQASDELFAGQLFGGQGSNDALLENLKNRRNGSSLEFGKLVPAQTFVSVEAIRVEEQFAEAQREYGFPATYLFDLMTDSVTGRPTDGFEFPVRENSIYIPTVGLSDVLDTWEEPQLKIDKYMQVTISPEKSDARFVSGFLNSELGRSIREANKTGASTRHFSGSSLKTVRLFVPPLATQKRILAIEALITDQMQTVGGLQNELASYHHELWSAPGRISALQRKVEGFSASMGGLRSQADAGLESWLETLPFPLSSILREWHRTPERNHQKRYEYLLHFFEATSEFYSAILLSAFTSNSTLYELTRNEFLKSLNAVTLTLRNPTFGTWNAIYSTLAKRIRSELNSGKAGRDLCAVLFSDPKLQIPQVITPKEIVPILERANELRNRRAHGALVSDRDARELEKTLVVLLQEFRNVTLDGWSRVDLIQPESCRVTSGRSLNTVSMLSGSHPGFLQTERQFASCLDSDYLYLSAKESQTALRLLSLFSLGAPPSSSRSAFYYFNGMDSVGTRFVSYHFADQSEIYLDNPEIQRDLRLIEQGLEIDFREDAEVGR